jgi:hypothetical protein
MELQYKIKNITGGQHRFLITGTKNNNKTGNVWVDAPSNFSITNTTTYQSLTVLIPTGTLKNITYISLVVSDAGTEYFLDDVRLVTGGGNFATGADPNKANIRLDNVAADLSTAEQDAIKNKLGVISIANEWEYFTGDGSTTIYTVTGELQGISLVEIDGRIQKLSTDYSVSGQNITFTSAPYSGATIGILKGFLIENENGINEGKVWRPNILESNTAEQNASLINTAIADAAPSLGTVILPAGYFLSRTIEWNPRVNFLGQGKKATTLQSTVAEPLINYSGNELYNPSANISKMSLYGGVDKNNKVGTVALNLGRIAFFTFRDLFIRWFDGHAGIFEGVLIGEINSVDVSFCDAGFKAFRAAASSVGSLNSNLIKFRHCTFSTVTSWAIEWEQAASIQLRECDFEAVGSSATGIIKVSNFCPNAEGVGLILDGCWGEYNVGTLISIQGNAAAKHSINRTMFQYGASAKSLEMDGGTVLLNGSTLEFPINVINGEFQTLCSSHGTVTLLNSSTHKTYTPITV